MFILFFGDICVAFGDVFCSCLHSWCWGWYCWWCGVAGGVLMFVVLVSLVVLMLMPLLVVDQIISFVEKEIISACLLESVLNRNKACVYCS